MAEQTPPQPGKPAAEAARSNVANAGAAEMAQEALDNAARAAQTLAAETGGGDGGSGGDGRGSPQPLNLQDFAAAGQGQVNPLGLGLLDDVTLRVKIELGRTKMYVEDVLRLNTNSIVELDKAAGDPVDIYVNDRHVARGEVLVLNENFCVRVSEIIQHVEDDE